ncbi:MAG: hypothetical protein HY049_20160 [Acidobacteria bacterium]|nr:hypothetical protein [Acidobacteriota bacterium]
MRCTECDVPLVAYLTPAQTDEFDIQRGPLTGRPIADELETTGPMVAGTYVTPEESQAALRALSDAGIAAEATSRGEAFPTNVSKYEPAYLVTVAAVDMPKARQVLSSAGLVPTAVARYRKEPDAHAAVAALESSAIRARISTLVLDEFPAEFRDEMEPYSVEVPAEDEGRAIDILKAHGLLSCEACGAQIQEDDAACRTCGEVVAI